MTNTIPGILVHTLCKINEWGFIVWIILLY